MSSPNRHATLHALCTRALRVRRTPRLDRGVKFFLRLRSSHLFQRQSVKPQGLTPFFSMAPFHFFGLFSPLTKISPVFTNSSKKHPGYPLPSPPNRNYSSYRSPSSPVRAATSESFTSFTSSTSFASLASVAATPPRCHNSCLRATRISARHRTVRSVRSFWGNYGTA